MLKTFIKENWVWIIAIMMYLWTILIGIIVIWEWIMKKDFFDTIWDKAATKKDRSHQDAQSQHSDKSGEK